MRNEGARRVVITGMGALTPLGKSVQEFRQGCLEGPHGHRLSDSFRPQGLL